MIKINLLHISVGAAVAGLITAAAAMWFASQTFAPVQDVSLLFTGSTETVAGGKIPATLSGCVSGEADVPVVLLSLFVKERSTESLLGPVAIALAEPGCRTTETMLIVPTRVTPGQWRVVLVTFAQGPLGAQTSVVSTEPFTVVEPLVEDVSDG